MKKVSATIALNVVQPFPPAWRETPPTSIEVLVGKFGQWQMPEVDTGTLTLLSYTMTPDVLLQPYLTWHENNRTITYDGSTAVLDY